MINRSIVRLLIYFLLLASLLFPLVVQSEEVIHEPQYLSKIVLCLDVEDYEPVYETTIFSIWDEKTVCWIRFNYQSQEPFMITWEWVGPEGRIYHTGELEMDAGDYYNYRTWYWISIQDFYAANLLGDWEVRVYVDDTLAAVKDFSLE